MIDSRRPHPFLPRRFRPALDGRTRARVSYPAHLGAEPGECVGRIVRQVEEPRPGREFTALVPAPDRFRPPHGGKGEVNGPAARLEGRSLHPARPHAGQKGQGNGGDQAVPGDPPAPPPRVIPKPDGEWTAEDIAEVPGQDGSADDGEEGHGPGLEAAEDRQRQPRQETLPAPTAEIEPEREGPQAEQREEGEAGGSRPDTREVLGLKRGTDPPGGDGSRPQKPRQFFGRDEGSDVVRVDQASGGQQPHPEQRMKKRRGTGGTPHLRGWRRIPRLGEDDPSGHVQRSPPYHQSDRRQAEDEPGVGVRPHDEQAEQRPGRQRPEPRRAGAWSEEP